VFARTLITENAHDKVDHRACIAIAGYSLLEVSRFGAKHQLPVLDGSRDLLTADCFLSDLEQMKGYEFDTVVIVNAREAVLPPEHAPPEEVFRHGCRLYVAMTRAKKQLVLSYSGSPSKWLTLPSVQETLGFDEWAACVDADQSLHIGEPDGLGQFDESPEADNATAALNLTGRQFLFTPFAYGLSLEAQEKLDQLVDGRGLLRGRERVRWRNIAELRGDLEQSAAARAQFGPRTFQEVIEVIDRCRNSSAEPRASEK
jgi:hypothetical protein